MEIKYQNRRRKQEGKPLLEPLYRQVDALATLPMLIGKEYQTWFTVIEGVTCKFTDAGHIIGSACVHLRIEENGQVTCVTFSGDIGRYHDPILRAPEEFPQADFIIMESTYGNRLHEDAIASVDKLFYWINHTCIEKKGKLIIPAFSVGRTQELLYFINQLELEHRLPPVEYIVDSPLSHEVTNVVESHTENFNSTLQEIMKKDNNPFKFKGMRFTRTVEESKQLNFRREPCVIISASGMAEAGRIKHHISNNIENSRNTILMVGYAEPHSLAGRLKKKPEEVSIFGVPHEVHAEIGEIKSMSAHGDYEDMFHWLKCQDPKKVQKIFLVHGEYDVQKDFAEKLKTEGFKRVQIPDIHEEFILTEG